jgi:arylsulfatase A-like enzyme
MSTKPICARLIAVEIIKHAPARQLLLSFKMKTFLTSLLFSLSLSLVAQKPPTTGNQPNIVIIYMDDMGYGDIEPFGMTGVSTPNFNRLASEGLRLTNFNVAQAVCTASRAALLTGCYPNRISISGALLPQSKFALSLEEQTIASLLKSNGYTTAILGKWHLGNKPPYFPLNYGFDTFYGLPYSHDMWPVDYQGNIITDSTNMRSHWPLLPVIENNQQVGSISTLQQQTQWTTSLTTRAVDFITGKHNAPFFLYLAHPLPHVPLAVSEKFKGKSELGIFGDVLMELDWSVGEVMKALDRAKLSDNTVLIVTSDNGPWAHFGDHAGSSGGLREGKGTAFEGGTRVPFIIRWPGKIKAGNVSGELMTNMDILPTLCQITGSKLPEKKIDGIDFSTFLTGKVTRGPREVFYYYYGNNKLMAVRYKHWKLVLNHESQSYSHGTIGMHGLPGSIQQKHPVTQALYDLSHDPGEAYDVQKNYPDIVKQIMVYVEQAREDLGDSITGRTGRNVRENAKVE